MSDKNPPIFTPTAPYLHVIPSISRRIAELFRSGLGAVLIRNAQIHTSSSLPQYTSKNEYHRALTEINIYIWKRTVFDLLQAHSDLIIRGVIRSKLDNGMSIQLHEIFSLQDSKTPLASGLEDLNIRGFCSISELGVDISSHHTIRSTLQPQIPKMLTSVDSFILGQYVKALLISVSSESEDLLLSMNPNRIPHSFTHTLGPCKNQYNTVFSNTNCDSSSTLLHLSDTYNSSSINSLSSQSITSLRFITDSPLFRNPNGVEIMRSAFHVVDYGSLSKQSYISPDKDISDGSEYDHEPFYLHLRKKQNKSWARESVERGIEYAKNRDFSSAMKCYTHAIQVNPGFSDVYVAKGAAYVLQENYTLAIQEFERALQVDPTDLNAHRYLEAVKSRKASNEKTINRNINIKQDSEDRNKKKRMSNNSENLIPPVRSVSLLFHTSKKRKEMNI